MSPALRKLLELKEGEEKVEEQLTTRGFVTLPSWPNCPLPTEIVFYSTLGENRRALCRLEKEGNKMRLSYPAGWKTQSLAEQGEALEKGKVIIYRTPENTTFLETVGWNAHLWWVLRDCGKKEEE